MVYSCDTCSRSYQSKDALTRHMKENHSSGQISINCKKCNVYSSYRLSTVERHGRTCKGKVSCCYKCLLIKGEVWRVDVTCRASEASECRSASGASKIYMELVT